MLLLAVCFFGGEGSSGDALEEAPLPGELCKPPRVDRAGCFVLAEATGGGGGRFDPGTGQGQLHRAV